MSSDLSTLILFVGMILSAVLSMYFALRILYATRGSNKGWLFYAVFGIANALNSFAGIIRNVLAQEAAVKAVLVVQSIMLLIVTVSIMLALTILAEVFGLSNKIFSRKNILICSGILLLALIVLDLSSFSTARLYSSAGIFFIAGLILTVVPLWKIMVNTHVLPWRLLFASHLTAIVSMYLIFATLGCCSGVLHGSALCPSITSPGYFTISPCSAGFAGLYSGYLMLLLVASWLQTGAFYFVHRRLH